MADKTKTTQAEVPAEETRRPMTFKERVLAAITEIKVPKGQYNEFGKYKYRSLDDIQAAFKVVGEKYRLWLRFSDDVQQIGPRYYVRSIASIVDMDGDGEFSAEAMAREEENKKGMDQSQITGSASSYARKYAANALLGLNDVKDADEVSGVTISSEAERVEYDSIVRQIDECKTVGALRSWWVRNERTIPYALHDEILNLCTERSKMMINESMNIGG